jgi:hypothetical protein
MIVITSHGDEIGKLTPKQFMQYMNRPGKFLSTLVATFNEQKSAALEPERARIRISQQ